MTTSNVWAIRAEKLSKVYRLHHRQLFKFLDILGLCPSGRRYYAELAAVDRVDLQIARGEKVAIIGRNGAGKSTLLRLISGILQPTAGVIEVHGIVKALLDIGSGFHPDFTGRDNVVAALAYQGIVGAAAAEKMEEIIEFAELEEYIDQPTKTYSTGMMMRLMFATATCVEPDILIADEVLGVGDAYFAHKSFERVKRLARSRGTTFLLVTHNFYSALGVCERFVWIERGRVMLDGPGMAIVDAYEQSIKEQEERREHRAKVRAAAAALNVRSPVGLTIRFRSRNGGLRDGSFYLRRLSAEGSDGRQALCELDSRVEGATFRVLPAGGVASTRHWGRSCVVLREYGDIFHKLDCWLSLSGRSEPPTSLELDYALDGTGTLVVSASADGENFAEIGALEPSPPGDWRTVRIGIPPTSELGIRPSKPKASGRYGTGDVTIEGVRVLDEQGEVAVVVRHGHAMRIEVDYLVRNRALSGEIVVAAGLHRDGYLPVASFVSPPFAPGTTEGTVTLSVDNVHMTNGEYMVAVGLVRPEVWRSGIFFSMSPDVLDHRPRVASFKVVDDRQIATGWVYVQEGKWTVRSRGMSR